jgi:hypothetical protein
MRVVTISKPEQGATESAHTSSSPLISPLPGDSPASIVSGMELVELMNRRGRHDWWDRCTILMDALFGECSCAYGCEECDRRRIIIENWIVQNVYPRLAPPHAETLKNDQARSRDEA